jgi:hypothetical protein
LDCFKLTTKISVLIANECFSLYQVRSSNRHICMHHMWSGKVPGIHWTKFVHFVRSWEVQYCDCVNVIDSVRCLCGWHVQRRNWLNHLHSLCRLYSWKVSSNDDTIGCRTLKLTVYRLSTIALGIKA